MFKRQLGPSIILLETNGSRETNFRRVTADYCLRGHIGPHLRQFFPMAESGVLNAR